MNPTCHSISTCASKKEVETVVLAYISGILILAILHGFRKEALARETHHREIVFVKHTILTRLTEYLFTQFYEPKSLPIARSDIFKQHF